MNMKWNSTKRHLWMASWLAMAAVCISGVVAGCDIVTVPGVTDPTPTPEPTPSPTPEPQTDESGLTAEELAAFQETNAECLVCHETSTPVVVADYMRSAKAKANVPCTACHIDNPDVSTGLEGHRFLPSPETCATCHPNQYAGHRANRHSIAMIRQTECGRFDDFPKEFQVGSGYHFTEEDVDQLSSLMNSGFQGTPGDAVVTSIQMCGNCHNVENRCDSCHSRHRFTPEESRHPNACATCHMGPDHPQIEMYDHSKHGARFKAIGDTDEVPVCVDCHMPYNSQMLGKKVDAEGNEYTDHDLSVGIAYGPIGGGTTRKGHTYDADTGRVKFVSRDSDAVYSELWMDRNDGKFYTAASGGEAVFDDLYAMSIADASSNGKQDYKVEQVADSPEKLLASRAFMRDEVCGRCHVQSYADEQLLTADLIHENTRTVLAEAFDIVRAQALFDAMYIDVDARPVNPETGTTGLYGANMILRNLNSVERMYFIAMKYENVKTWKGAYHQNPDYTHWYGWSALIMNLGDIGDEATDNVLMNMWMTGQVYPGPTGDPVEDGVYQGVIYENGSLTNIYDKFPGSGDPGASDPIDMDMDGTDDFLPVEGSPGTFMFGETEVTFH